MAGGNPAAHYHQPRWSFRVTPLPDRKGTRFEALFEDRPAAYADVIRGWREEADFPALFNGVLEGVRYPAYRWETPPITSATVGRPFEFVVVDDPGLSRDAEPGVFRKHFVESSADGIATFANLGGDATLVVPCPRGSDEAYAHLASFVRGAPPEQTTALWRAVGNAMARRIGDRPVWLSTAGAGVAWLHVRLDDRPKYYSYAPYRRA